VFQQMNPALGVKFYKFQPHLKDIVIEQALDPAHFGQAGDELLGFGQGRFPAGPWS